MKTFSDNGEIEAKVEVRRAALACFESPPRVLDCFAGLGIMHDEVWKAGASLYLGMDKKFSRSKSDPHGLCLQGDNRRLIMAALRKPWDLVDLDAYSNPWPLARQVVNGSGTVDKLVITATCGMDRAIRGGTGDFAAAVAGMKLEYTSLLTRWYDDVIRWALAWCVRDSAFTIARVRVVKSEHNQLMRYWLIELARTGQAVAPVKKSGPTKRVRRAG